jgi:hypothetical protein
MILYDLKCAKNHVFEAWFRDSKAFDSQAKSHKIVCPTCGSKRVTKAPMAPRLSMGRAAEAPQVPSEPAGRKVAMVDPRTKVLQELRQFVESNCDYVGPKFAEEARKIHYGEVEKRGIYGEATPDEAKELADEDIEVRAIPWPERGDA